MKAAIAERIDIISYTLTAIARVKRTAGHLSARGVATRILRDFPSTVLSLSQLESEVAAFARERGIETVEPDAREHAWSVAAAATAALELAQPTDGKLHVVKAAREIVRALPGNGPSVAEVEDDLVRLAVSIGVDIDFNPRD